MERGNEQHTEVAKLLIKAGANLETGYYKGSTALIEAAYEGNTELVELLIEVGANVNAKDDRGRTALSFAQSSESRAEIAKLLIAAGAKR